MNSKNLKLKHRDTIDFSKKDFGDLVYIGVYTSRKCNLKCKYCFENSSKPDSNETTLKERLDVISQAKQLGAEVLLIAGAGEPLVDENLFSMIKHAHNLKMGSLIYTNALENKNGEIETVEKPALPSYPLIRYTSDRRIICITINNRVSKNTPLIHSLATFCMIKSYLQIIS